MYRSYVMICGGPNCTLLAGRQEKLAEEFEVQLKLAGLRKEVQVMRGGCLGLCSSGPNVAVFPEGTIYSHVHVEDVAEIVSEHLLKGGRVDRLLYNENEATSTVRSLEETEFYKKQLRIALRNCGVIDPQNIDEYIARDGYAALEKCLTELTPDEVIQIVLDSGLRGRGGAGFPTGLKWRFASGERGQVQKYVCCNADEGDPGAFMDRSVLEGDPHSIIEAMAIAGYAIGASQGYIYVRAEYPIAVKHLQIALEQARSYGLLGEDIFGTGFSFDLEIKLGAGAFVCGEETALMTSIEGQTGRAPAPAALPGGEGLVPAAHHPKQRGDLRQHLPRSFCGGRSGSPPSAARRARGPRYLPWAGVSRTPAWWRCPWAPPCALSWRRSGAASPTGRSSRPPRPAAPPADASPRSTSTPLSTTTIWPPSGP